MERINEIKAGSLKDDWNRKKSLIRLTEGKKRKKSQIKILGTTKKLVTNIEILWVTSLQ